MALPIAKPDASLPSMPVEIMAIIIGATNPKHDFILSPDHIFSLRLSCRALYLTTFDVFARRFFSTRRHMLSRASLQCLLDVAQCPRLNTYVKEVIIGPERINKKLDTFMERPKRPMNAANSGQQQWWERRGEAGWQDILDEQTRFEDSGELEEMLGKAFRMLGSLKNVHIDAYAADMHDDNACWTKTWGVKGILEQIGVEYFEGEPSVDTHHVLVDKGKRFKQWRGHERRTLEALGSIQNRLDWTLELSFRHLDAHTTGEEFESTLGEYWPSHCLRVRKANFRRGLGVGNSQSYFSTPWVVVVMQQCPNMASLTWDQERFTGGAYQHIELRHLRHLTIRASCLPNEDFFQFLEKHAATLENIVIEDTLLTMYPGLEVLDLTHGDIATWFDVLEMMREMPRLKAVQLSGLAQDYDWKGMQLSRTGVDTCGRSDLRSTSIFASRSEIGAKLRLAVDEAIMVVRSEYRRPGTVAEARLSQVSVILSFPASIRGWSSASLR